MNNFKTGDVVELKNGISPSMLVGIDNSGCPEKNVMVNVLWYDRKSEEFKTALLPFECLKLFDQKKL